MLAEEKFNSLYDLGLYKSVTILSSLTEIQTVSSLLTKAKAFIQLGYYHSALETLDKIFQNSLSEDEWIEFLELKFTCCLNIRGGVEKC